MKFAVAYSFIGVIAGEFVQAGAGMGHAIAFAYNSFDNLTMYGLMILLFGLVGTINMTLWSWERRLYAAGYQGLHWPKEYGGQGLTLVEHLIVNEELGRVSAPEGINTMGKELVGPILHFRGVQGDRWRVSALFVLNGAAEPPDMAVDGVMLPVPPRHHRRPRG